MNLSAGQNTSMVVVHNLAAHPVSVALRAREAGSDRLVRLLDDDHSRATRGRHGIELDGFAYRWYRVGGLDDVLHQRAW